MAGDFSTSLAFFDTISHQTLEEVNLDLIQFPRPLIIKEIRIISSGVKLAIDVPRQRVGGTNPSKFRLEFFVNNLARPGASAFHKLGEILFDANNELPYVPSEQIPTDGLILRGAYTSLSLAVIGVNAQEETPESPQKPVRRSLEVPDDVRQEPVVQIATGTKPKIILQSSAQSQSASHQVHSPVTTSASASSASYFDSNAPSSVATPFTPPVTVSPSIPHSSSAVTVTPSIPHSSSAISSPSPSSVPSSSLVHGLPPKSSPSAVVSQQQPGVVPVSTTARSSGTPTSVVPPGVLPLLNYRIPPPGYGQVPISMPPLHAPPPGIPPPNISRPFQQQNVPAQFICPPMFDLSRPPPMLPRSGGPEGISEAVDQELGDYRERLEAKEENAGKPEAQKHAPSGEECSNVKQIDSFSRKNRRESLLEEGALKRDSFSEYGSEDEEQDQVFDYENISDEEFDFGDLNPDDLDMLNEEFLAITQCQFNPLQFEITPLKFLKPPQQSHKVHDFNATDNMTTDASENIENLCNLLSNNRNCPYNESWVECVESVVKLLERDPDLLNYDKLSDLKAVLADWSLVGTDFAFAMLQQQPAFKIRHMKCGVKLCTVICAHSPQLASQLIDNCLHHKLVDLFTEEFMSVPIKLLILQALEATTIFGHCLKSFVNVSHQHAEKGSPYQRLVKHIISVKEGTRVVSAVAPLMNRIHFYEVLQSLRDIIQTLISSKEDGEHVLMDSALQKVVEFLKEIAFLYKNSIHLIRQPHKSRLPVGVVFEGAASENDPFPLYNLLDAGQLLESLFVNCSTAPACNDVDVLSEMEKLLRLFMVDTTGLLYLLSRSDVFSGILSLLLQPSPEDTNQEPCDMELPLQQLGVEFAYRLQALLYVDELLYYHSTGSTRKEVDNLNVMNTLHKIYVLSAGPNGPIGQRAVVDVFTSGKNLNAILPFMELTGDPDWDNKMKKSACTGYASELLLTVLRTSSSVEMLREFSEKLISISMQEVTSKIHEVKQWVEVLQKLPGFNYESVDYLATRVKNYVTDGIVPKLPKGLITTLRILQYLCIEPTKDHGLEVQEKLKYKYALMQLYAAETFPVLVQIIEKFSENILYRWQQGLSLNSRQGHLIAASICPTLALVKAMLCCLIQCRAGEFKDVTCVAPLVKLYTVTCTLVPLNGFITEISDIQQDVVAALLAYAQPSFSSDTSELDSKGVQQSLWTMMLKEIMNFTMQSPYCFIGALNVLCELLPLQLPVVSREAISTDESATIINSRSLWSVHLVPLTVEIQLVIKQMTETTFQPLLVSLRRFCVQLSDLSPQTAVAVTRALFDVLLNAASAAGNGPDSKDSVPESDKSGATIAVSAPQQTTQDAAHAKKIVWAAQPLASVDLSHALNFVSSLISSHPPIKAAFISIIATSKQDEPYALFVPGLLTILNHVSSETQHLASQESIVSILSSLLDPSISLISEKQTVTLTELASSIPSMGLMSNIAVALFSHIGNCQHSLASILPSLRALSQLLVHDYGLYTTKCALESQPLCLLTLCEKLESGFSRDSSDCLSTLSTLVDLLRGLLCMPTPDDGYERRLLELRSRNLNLSFVRKLLEWRDDGYNNLNLLMKLSLRLQGSKDDDSLGALSESLLQLIELLEKTVEPSKESTEEFPALALPEPLGLQEQWEKRQKFVILGDSDDDRLSPDLWLPSMVLQEEEDTDTEKVPTDLEALRLRFFPLYDLNAEILRRVSVKNTEPVKPMRSRPLIISTASGNKRPFIAPMRGRGFGNRGGNNRLHNDPFRSRPPNTSRPPSMHVDDFVQHFQSPSQAEHRDVRPSGRNIARPFRGNRGSGNRPFGGGPGNIGGNRRFQDTKSPRYDSPRDRMQRSPRVFNRQRSRSPSRN